jgi:uncharacterized membrane protein YfcA
MNTLEMALLVWLGSVMAGFVGALTGLGGGIIITPLLTLAFGVDIRYAIGATLISVIATSSGAAAAYVKEGFSNIRIGMFLEIATTIGAVTGASIAARVPTSWIAVMFGLVLIYSAYASSRPPLPNSGMDGPDRIATLLRMDSSFPTPSGPQSYHVRAVPAGFSLMFVAGAVSGLLGIGSGALKVIAMDRAMRLPFKVSTTTSNFMIGVTAAASAGVYLRRGYVDPGLAMPVMLGVLLGSFLGARVLTEAKSQKLRFLFGIVVAVMAIEMIYHGLTGRL